MTDTPITPCPCEGGQACPACGRVVARFVDCPHYLDKNGACTYD